MGKCGQKSKNSWNTKINFEIWIVETAQQWWNEISAQKKNWSQCEAFRQKLPAADLVVNLWHTVISDYCLLKSKEYIFDDETYRSEIQISALNEVMFLLCWCFRQEFQLIFTVFLLFCAQEEWETPARAQGRSQTAPVCKKSNSWCSGGEGGSLSVL